MLEQRKLQKLGHSTLMVSLPRKWVDQLNLKRGDMVGLATDEEGRLIVHPSLKMLPANTKIIINVDGMEPSLVRRMIFGAYVAGHEMIEIRTKTDFTTKQIDIVRKSLNELIGVGIVEQQPRRLVIQSFLDPSKFPIDGLIMRLYLIVESMIDLAVQALIDGKNQFATQCVDSSVEANKVYFLAVRQILQAVRDKGLAERVGLSNPRHPIGDRLVLMALEEVGDLSMVIARGAIKINDSGSCNSSINNNIRGLRQQVKRMAVLTMESVSKRDAVSANSSINEYDVLVELEQKVTSNLQKGSVSIPGFLASELRSITQGLLQVGGYYKIVAEIMINRAAEESTKTTEVVSFNGE